MPLSEREVRVLDDGRTPVRRTPWRFVGLLFVLWIYALGMTQAGSVNPTHLWVDIYSIGSVLDGQPIPAGASIAIFDPQGTQCGETTVTYPGQLGIMPCYGDDPYTPLDEGAQAGDALVFAINGRTATPEALTLNGTPVPPGTAVTWIQSGIRWQVNLHTEASPHVSIAVDTGATALSWSHETALVAVYEVWRSTRPYLGPDEEGTECLATLVPSGTNPLIWTDPDTTMNCYYRVRGLNAAGQLVSLSRPVGRFTFAISRDGP